MYLSVESMVYITCPNLTVVSTAGQELHQGTTASAGMPQRVAVMPLLQDGQIGMNCFKLAVIPLKESCRLPDLKLNVNIKSTTRFPVSLSSQWSTNVKTVYNLLGNLT